MIVGYDRKKIEILKQALSKSFELKDTSLAKKVVAIHIVWDKTKRLFWLSNEKYVTNLLQRLSVENVRPTSSKLSEKQCLRTKTEKVEMSKVPYASTVRSLIYAMFWPNIRYVVGVVNMYMSNPRREHWVALKWIFRYLIGTSNVCLRFDSSKPILEHFTDSDMSANKNTNRSMSGYLMT